MFRHLGFTSMCLVICQLQRSIFPKIMPFYGGSHPKTDGATGRKSQSVQPKEKQLSRAFPGLELPRGLASAVGLAWQHSISLYSVLLLSVFFHSCYSQILSNKHHVY